MSIPPLLAAGPIGPPPPVAAADPVQVDPMQVWAQAHPNLAAKVKPGQSGHEAIAKVLEQLPPDQRPAPPSPVPAARPSDAQYQTWALANKTLAMKVRPGQAGHDPIQKALAELPPSARLVPPPPVPAPAPSEAQYQAWALNNLAQARKVQPGQAGYEAIQAALAKLDAMR